MNNEKDVEQTPELKALVERYQSTKAPLGFSERVSAHINDSGEKSGWSSVIAGIWGSPKFIAATSIGLVAIFSILIVQLTVEIEPDIQEMQIAQLEESTPKTTNEVESTRIEESINIDQLIEQSTVNDEVTNFAVLSEISDWLEEESESITPDFTNLPDLGEIDALLDVT